MPAISYAVRLLASTLGACLEAFLLVVVLRKSSGAPRMKLLAAMLALAALWHADLAAALRMDDALPLQAHAVVR